MLQSLSDFKLALRQQTESGDSPSSTSQEALGLCKAVHKFHFQLLVLLGSYVKLLAMLDKPMETSPVSETTYVVAYAPKYVLSVELNVSMLDKPSPVS